MQINPNKMSSHYHLGLVDYKLGNLGEALDQFQAIIDNNNHDLLCYEARGLTFQKLQDHEAAIGDFNSGLRQ